MGPASLFVWRRSGGFNLTERMFGLVPRGGRIQRACYGAAASPATQIIACLEASHTSDQLVLSETMVVEPSVKFVRDKTLAGDRRIRASLSGETTIRYQATVENNVRQLLPPAGRQYLCSELAADVLPFLLPSRFCRSDKFMPFAQREFGDSGDGVARIMSMSPTRHERN